MKLPSNWNKTSLKYVAEVRSGIAKGKSDLKSPVTLPYLRVANVQDGYINLDEVKVIEVEKDKIDRYSLKKGDVLMNEGGDFDKLGRGDVWLGQIEPCLHQNHVFAVRPDKKKIDSFFLSALAASNYGKTYFLNCAKRSTNLASINSTQIKEFPVLIPPLPEQKKIAQILSTWDKAITTTEQLLANSQQQKKALMQQLLTGKKRLLDENGVRFSEQWNYTEIKELLRESRITSNNSDPSKRLTVKLNLKGIEIRKFRGTEAINSTTHFIRKTGQFIYGKQNIHKGALGIIPPELNGFETSQDLPTFDFTEKCESSWFLHFMSQEHFLSSLESKMSGTGSKRLSPKVLLNIKILFPHLKEQQKITSVLSTADREITFLQQKLDRLKQEKKALMQQLLTGKRRVKVEEAA